MNNVFEHRKGVLITAIGLVLAAAVLSGTAIGYILMHGNGGGLALSVAVLAAIPVAAYVLYRQLVFPYYRRLEDANLELHLKQEELLDIKDDLFIKFLGVYDVNYAANSPRLFMNRMKDVADVTARVMEADLCLIFLYDKKKDELVLEATNKDRVEELKSARIPLGRGIEAFPLSLRVLPSSVRVLERSTGRRYGSALHQGKKLYG
jgi:hypothetical protein